MKIGIETLWENFVVETDILQMYLTVPSINYPNSFLMISEGKKLIDLNMLYVRIEIWRRSFEEAVLPSPISDYVGF